jgi:hypothetical protein
VATGEVAIQLQELQDVVIPLLANPDSDAKVIFGFHWDID